MSEGPLKQTEKEFLAQIIELAILTGWLVHHVFEQRQYARRTDKGFPDLVLVRPPRLLFVEAKSEKGKISPAQDEWLSKLRQCFHWHEAIDSHIPETYVWRPSDWPEIVRVLERR